MIWERLMDRFVLYGKLWNVSCILSLSSMTGGYYDEHILDKLNEAMDEYEKSKASYGRKWAARNG
jgi:hypothetical protein